MLPVLQIGPLAIQTSGLVLLIGLWIGLSVTDRYAAKSGIDPNLIYNLTLIVIAFGIVGARLGYIASYPTIFLSSPMNIISLNPGLLDPWSGAAVGLLSGLVYGRHKQLPIWKTLDLLTPMFAILFIAKSLSNLASGNGYGASTGLPWGIWLWGDIRHPTQIYELLAGVAILYLIWPGKRLGKMATPGTQCLSFLALSSGAQLFLEAFRGESILLPGGIRFVQVAAWLLLAFSLWQIGVRIKKSTAA